MNCQEFWNTMPAGATPHPHLEECAACAARMRRYNQLAAGMRAMAAGMARTEAPPRVEARLVAAFRAHTGTPVERPSRRRWIPALTWAAAFAVTIAFGVLLLRQRQPQAASPAPRRVEMVADLGSSPLDAAVEEGFLPLPGAAGWAPSDDVSVVRVELPRSAMMRVGIEVSPERADETVEADVMVGADGLARAVRFVETEGGE